MANKLKARTLRFPTGGIDRRYGFPMQPPYTTPVALNVFPDSQENGRERGGSRPGLRKAFDTQLPGPINMQGEVQFTNGTSRDRCYVAAAAGTLWRSYVSDFTAGVTPSMTQVTTDLTIAADTLIQCSPLFDKLWIADYSTSPTTGTDGTTDGAGTSFDSATYSDWTAEGIDADDYVVVVRSTGNGTEGVYTISSVTAGSITLSSSAGTNQTGIHFSVERGTKVYDPAADTLTLWTADASATDHYVPQGNPVITTWRERAVLGGGHDNPHAWYMSRSGNPENFDYGAQDELQAVAGTDNLQVQEPLTALIPHHNDCLIYGCTDSLWALNGDPAHGGNLTNLSLKIGVIGPAALAWCKTASKATVFLSKDGVYQMIDPCGEVPQSISREKLPIELLNLDTSQRRCLLEYDRLFRGVHIYITEL